ncbi:hypothetical protein BDV96DRAFT_637554 [Lophiotrema nucula]|uniref:Uncharacterized protein n=1 Tax=Lophiotrema nucula TaxID=690887 RepID=A0A6A5YJT3_9PLEO|nr:hypothetical protein BDV96DRAFT_637554 [Lophiotrema nucula]
MPTPWLYVADREKEFTVRMLRWANQLSILSSIYIIGTFPGRILANYGVVSNRQPTRRTHEGGNIHRSSVPSAKGIVPARQNGGCAAVEKTGRLSHSLRRRIPGVAPDETVARSLECDSDISPGYQRHGQYHGAGSNENVSRVLPEGNNQAKAAVAADAELILDKRRVYPVTHRAGANAPTGWAAVNHGATA